MANENAWNQGWALGAGRAAEQRAHKQALSDQEFEMKATRYADELATNRATLASIDQQKNPGAYAAKIADMQRNLQDIRELYHPHHRPDAVSRFGHLLTDRLGLTHPQARIRAEATRRMGAGMGDQREAQGLAAAAPLTPEQQAVQTEGVDTAGRDARIQGKVNTWRRFNPNATPEQIQQATDIITQNETGIASGKMGKAERVLGKVNGVPMTLVFRDGRYWTLNGELAPEEIVADFEPDKKEVNPKLTADERKRADYAEYIKIHPALKEQTFEAWLAEQSALGRRAGAPPIAKGGAAGKGGKETPEQIKANEAVDAAEASYEDVRIAGGADGGNHIFNAVDSAGIVMSWLRGKVNRVTQTEINWVNNLGGIEMKLEGNVAHIVKGTMAPQQYQWFLQATKRNYEIAQQVASKYKPSGVKPQGGGGEVLPDAAKAQLKEGIHTTYANGQTWTLENGQPKQVK